MTGQPRTRAVPRRTAGSWCLVLLSSLAWLILSGIVRQLTDPAAAMILLVAVFLLGASDQVLERARCSFPPRRKLDGHALAAALALLLTVVLAVLHGRLSPGADALAFLLAVIAVALAGGLIPAVIEAVAGSLLLRSLVTLQPGKSAIAGVSDAAVPGVLVGLAVVVGLLAEGAARRTWQAARAAEAARLLAEADLMRTALLAAASQDLRSPLASAKAALSCLRSSDVQLVAGDTDELLAAVEESLGRLARLAVSLPDIRQPRTGSLMPAIDRSYW
jgi:two-component system, OmpR family, sensor histidine kinase KdpD